MLFDLVNDPNEINNLAGQPEHAQREATMKAAMERQWDYEAIDRKIRASQKERLFVQEALLNGKWTSWDYQPIVDASRKYVRGAVDPDTTATKSKQRFPFVEEVKPHNPRDPNLKLDMGS